MFWIPDLLNKMFDVDIKELVLPLIIIYTMASIGGIGGGWLSSSMIKNGKSIDYARKTAMIICAFMMISILFIPVAGKLWIAVVMLSLSTAAHQGWSSNVFTIASDIFPRNMVGSIISLAGLVSAIAGAFTATLIGIALQLTHSYTMVFLVAGSMYFLFLLLLRLMIPKIESLSP